MKDRVALKRKRAFRSALNYAQGQLRKLRREKIRIDNEIQRLEAELPALTKLLGSKKANARLTVKSLEAVYQTIAVSNPEPDVSPSNH